MIRMHPRPSAAAHSGRTHGRSCADRGYHFIVGLRHLVRHPGWFLAIAAAVVIAITAAMVMTMRNIFGELMEGMAGMKSHREGKLILRSFQVEPAPLPKVVAKLIRGTRRKLGCSRAMFARQLRINLRTLEKWKQRRSQPNPQAAALVLLVRQMSRNPFKYFPATCWALQGCSGYRVRSPRWGPPRRLQGCRLERKDQVEPPGHQGTKPARFLGNIRQSFLGVLVPWW